MREREPDVRRSGITEVHDPVDGGGRPLNLSVGVITIPLSKSGVVPLRNLIEILCDLSTDVRLVTGNAGYEAFADDTRLRTSGVRMEAGRTAFRKILNNASAQLLLCCKMVRMSRGLGTWILFMGADTLVLPAVVARLLRKRVVIVFSGSYAMTQEVLRSPLRRLVSMSTNLNCTLANRIVLYSRNHVSEWGLGRFDKKIIIAHRHFVDFGRFKMSPGVEHRRDDIGYVGRLSREKGVVILVEAIQILKVQRPGIRLLIAGDGPLLGDLERAIDAANLKDSVELLGWVPHDRLPGLFGRLKLLVLPSYTEGLPNTLLEAMAAGTVVVATGVGGVPDLIIHGQNGFIIRDTSAEAVAEGIVQALDAKNLQSVAANARETVEGKFQFTRVAARWKKLLAEDL